VFPGTLTSRVYLKLSNDKCERTIEGYTELISLLSWVLGDNYEKDRIFSLWKKLLRNHPHDNICGVCIDDVHSAMEESFKRIFMEAKKLMKDKLERLVGIIDTSGATEKAEAYVLFNTTPEPRTTIITLKPSNRNLVPEETGGKPVIYQKNDDGTLDVLVDDIPSFGYKTVYLKSSRGKKRSIPDKIKIDEENRIIENKYLRIRIAENGTLEVYDKINKTLYNDLGLFEDIADSGDSYSYSGIPGEKPIRNSKNRVKVEFLHKSGIRCLVKVTIEMSLPESLNWDINGRCKKLKKMPVITLITIDADSPLISFSTWVKNTVKDHRLRVLFPTGLNTTKSVAGSQFDVVEYDIDPAPYNDDIPEEARNIFIEARELKPITTLPHRFFVDISDGSRGITVINRGLHEYEVLENLNTIALTLFRSVGWLARENLFGRMGDAGPMIRTPGGQCLREMVFNYALYFHGGNWEKGKVLQMANFFNFPCLSIKTDSHRGVFQDKKEFIKLLSTTGILRITGLKLSEDGKAMIIRSYNPSQKEINGTLSTSFKILSAWYTYFKRKCSGRNKEHRRK